MRFLSTEGNKTVESFAKEEGKLCSPQMHDWRHSNNGWCKIEDVQKMVGCIDLDVAVVCTAIKSSVITAEEKVQRRRVYLPLFISLACYYHFIDVIVSKIMFTCMSNL